MTKFEDNQSPYITFLESAAPGTPASTLAKAYVKTDGFLYFKNDAGVEICLNRPPGYEFDYAQVTSNTNVTATTEGGADTIITGAAVTYDGSTVLVEFFYHYITIPAGNNVLIVLADGGTSIGKMAQLTNNDADVARQSGTVQRRFTPSAASHTYSIEAYVGSAATGVVGAGAGGSGAAMPSFMRITKV